MANDKKKSDDHLKRSTSDSVPFLLGEIRAEADFAEKGSVVLHKKSDGQSLEVKFEDLKSEAMQRVHDILAIFSDSAASLKNDMVVDEISVQLGISAKGKVFFVAEGSANAMINIKLKRKT